MSVDNDVSSQCPYCGYPRFAQEHAPDCPENKSKVHEGPATTVRAETAAETPEQRIAAARQRLQEAVDTAKKEIKEAVKNGRLKNPGEHRADSSEIEDAKEIIEDLLAAHDLPKVTLPREYLKTVLSEGLKERETSYQRGVMAIVGTVGREPLLPDKEDRVVLELDLKPDEITPRFTGPEKIFEGVVAVRGTAVPPDKIRVIDPKAARPPKTGTERTDANQAK